MTVEYTAEEILANPLGRGVEPHQVTGIIVIVEYIDKTDGKLRLSWRTDVPTWRAYGMAGSVAEDARKGEMAWDDEDDE